MAIFPYISIDDSTFFTRLQAYKWMHSRDRFQTNRLTREVLPALASLVESLGGYDDPLLIVNCSGLDPWKEGAGADRDFAELRRQDENTRRSVEKSGVAVLFTRCSERTHKLIHDVFFTLAHRDHGRLADGILVTRPPADLPSVWDRALPLVTVDHQRYIRDRVIGSFRETPPAGDLLRLRSTPLKANGYFDANRLLGDPDAFPWLACLMADRLRSLLDREPQPGRRPGDPRGGTDDGLRYRLLACTRNGAVLASAVRNLLPSQLRVDVVDRFGPIPRTMEVYDGGEDDENTPNTKFAYIYIGDFIIAGTELRMAEAHAYYRNIPLVAALVIGSVIRPDVDDRAFGRVVVEALFPLLDLGLELKYEFPG
jgi:hypothetical protein